MNQGNYLLQMILKSFKERSLMVDDNSHFSSKKHLIISGMNSNKLTLILFLLILLCGCSQPVEVNQEAISDEDETILIGKIDLVGLGKEPYSLWFDENYVNYTVDAATVEGLIVDDIDIKIFLGTWCEDSQIQVPQFFKILNHLGYDISRVEMVGVYHRPGLRLTGPNHEEEGLNIEFVPTFIFYREGEEIGRIAEYPKASLEKDMAEIVMGRY